MQNCIPQPVGKEDRTVSRAYSCNLPLDDHHPSVTHTTHHTCTTTTTTTATNWPIALAWATADSSSHTWMPCGWSVKCIHIYVMARACLRKHSDKNKHKQERRRDAMLARCWCQNTAAAEKQSNLATGSVLLLAASWATQQAAASMQLSWCVKACTLHTRQPERTA